MISRDRGGAYAEAAREAAPNAIQIADRFHLSQNVGETVVRIRPLSINEPKNNAKKIKWLVEPIGILVIYNVLPEEERIVHLMRFRSSRSVNTQGPMRTAASSCCKGRLLTHAIHDGHLLPSLGFRRLMVQS